MVTAASNTGALSSKRFLEINQQRAERATEELASGSRVSNPAYNPAAAAIGYGFQSDLDAMKQIGANINQARAMIYMATGVLGATEEVLSRMNTIATQANSDALSSTERKMLDEEMQALIAQVDANVESGEWGGVKLFEGSGGSVSAIGTAAAAYSGFAAAPTNTLLGATGFVAGSSSGFYSGMVNSVDVTAGPGGTYDVTIQVGNQTFKGNTLPANGTNMVLTSTTDVQNKIAIAYDAGDVSGISTVATFKAALEQNLGLNTGTRAVLTSASTALANATFSAGAGTKAGSWAVTYVEATAGNTGQFKLTNGQDTYYANLNNVSNSMTTTIGFANGASLALSTFDGTAPGAQSLYTVGVGTSVQRDYQIGLGGAMLSATFKGAGATAIGVAGITVQDKAGASAAVSAISTAMDTISGYIAELGGKVSRLNFLEDNLRVAIQNREVARSSFVDADLPEAMMASQKYKSLSQISGHVFTQALQKDSRLAQMVQNTQ